MNATSPQAGGLRPSGQAEAKTTRRARRTLALAGCTAIMMFAGIGVAQAAPPAKLPGNAEWLETKWLPEFDYDTDGCYPSVAIGPDGTLNGGLKPTGSLSGDCHDASDLANSNTYSRYKCNNGWCAIYYLLYFEKDQVVANVESGHRHDWEGLVVWTQDVGSSAAQYVSTSAHGGFAIHSAADGPWDGTHVQAVYHKESAGSHNVRLAKWGEAPENASGAWHQPTLVGWSGFPAALRTAVSSADWGSANFELKDGRFNDQLAKAKPAGIAFDPYAS